MAFDELLRSRSNRGEIFRLRVSRTVCAAVETSRIDAGVMSFQNAGKRLSSDLVIVGARRYHQVAAGLGVVLRLAKHRVDGAGPGALPEARRHPDSQSYLPGVCAAQFLSAAITDEQNGSPTISRDGLESCKALVAARIADRSMGRQPLAIADLKRALALDPLSLQLRITQSSLLYFSNANTKW